MRVTQVRENFLLTEVIRQRGVALRQDVPNPTQWDRRHSIFPGGVFGCNPTVGPIVAKVSQHGAFYRTKNKRDLTTAYRDAFGVG